MYLYATSVRGGLVNPNKVMEWALAMTEKINQVSEVTSSLWTTTLSPGLGRLTWVSVVEDLAVIPHAVSTGHEIATLSASGS